MPEPQISAIICTHNRDNYLGAAIDSLLAQKFTDFEIIVVDNASTDQTRQVVESRLPEPKLQYVYESVLGLSVARNTGAKNAKAPILAYLDDDAVASPQWLQAIHHAYQQNERLAVAGGKVTLLWPEGTEAPKWLSPSLAGNLGAYDLGDSTVYITEPGLTPRGLNYSIRRRFLNQIGGFDANLGRVGTRLLSNEELLMTQEALKRGWQIAYLPDALVAHNVAPERMQRRWFLQRGWWQGISEYYREQLSGKTGPHQFSRGGERLLRGLVKYIKNANHPDIRFENLVYAYGQLGYLTSVVKGMLTSKGES
jgi:glycosyltransferase involved in cell wall biosynthesis